jgi:hypothetical protein
MVYLLATYIREDKLNVTRSVVLYEGNRKGAMDALAQETDSCLDDGCTIAEEDAECIVLKHRSRYGIGDRYTTILQVYQTGMPKPYYNE